MKIKEILVLLVIIIAGIIFYYAQTGNLDFYIELGDDFFENTDVFTFENTRELSPPFPTKMEITNQYGNIKVTSTEESKISIFTEKKVREKTEERAKERADKLEILISQDSEQIIVSSQRNKHMRSDLRTDLEIYVPKDFSLSISNSYGLVEVKEIKNAEIINKHGPIAASSIKGNLHILSSYKPIIVDTVEGSCQIESLSSRIDAMNIKGRFIIKNKYGSIDLKGCSQNVIINAPHCRIKGDSISGPIEAENSYKPLELSNIESAKIRADNSPIKIYKAQKDLDIKNKYSRITLDDINGNINIEGDSLEIIGENMFGEFISISNSYRNIDLSHFSAETLIYFSHGKIKLSPSTENIKPITVKGEYAEIDFILPPGLKIPIQAQTKSAQIEWKLSQKGIKQINNGYSILKAYLEKDEKPIVSLFTTYHNILIRENT